MKRSSDVVVVGGGLVGLATALALTDQGATVTVMEAEERLAAHQSGHNSGVIHAGLYYKPGSLKAELCGKGREALIALCEAEGVPYQRTGKLVVAAGEAEIAALDELERRGRANGLVDLRRLDEKDLRTLEPAVAGIAGLWVGETGIVDYVRVADTYRRRIEAGGGEVRCGSRVVGWSLAGGVHRLTTRGGSVEAAYLVTCGGLYADRLARLCGAEPGLKIVPFRGEYYELIPSRRSLVRMPVYPVPDPAFPFLGVHFTPTVDGRIEAGPNAVLAFSREGYRFRDLSPRDLLETVTYPGFRHLARRYWRNGLIEMRRSLRKADFVAALRRLVPSIQASDIVRGGSGVRAQAVTPDGRLVDDFHLLEAERAVHVLNAPSPAATASLAIGGHIARGVLRGGGRLKSVASA